jgi:transcriptional regulator with XRE-family HTH domain
MGRGSDLAMTEGADVAAMLRQARRHAGLSQLELARRAGITREEVSVYERHARQPSAAAFLRLMANCGVPLGVSPSPGAVAVRERALEDVLDLADALPQRWPGQLRYPTFAGLEGRRHGGR